MDGPSVDMDQALADLHGTATELRFVALDALARLNQEQALSDRLYERSSRMSTAEWGIRTTVCRMCGHDWQDIKKPLVIKRWCARCYEIEDR